MVADHVLIIMQEYRFNSLGFDQYGFDKHGYDTFGLDKNGYNRYGVNSLGYNRNGQRIKFFDFKTIIILILLWILHNMDYRSFKDD
jgi:hypothetical protein